MANTSRYQRVRTRLFNLNPYCPECGVLMILPESLPEHSPGKIKHFPPNTCTYEHVYSRLNPDRSNNKLQRQNIILCLKCNNIKGKLDELKYLTPEEHKLRSKRRKDEKSI